MYERDHESASLHKNKNPHRKKEGNIKREKERKKERQEAVFSVNSLLGICNQEVIKRKRFKVVFNLKL